MVKVKVGRFGGQSINIILYDTVSLTLLLLGQVGCFCCTLHMHACINAPDWVLFARYAQVCAGHLIGHCY